MKKLKVLVCDDSPLVRKQISKILTANEVEEIIEAKDGEQAVLQYAKFLPDITFMDIVMPVQSGVEALKKIKSLNSNAKVVMVSSVGTQANLKDAIENGAFDFIQKPITDTAIQKIMTKING